MHRVTTPHVDIAIPEREPSFQIDGEVIEVLPGCGMATVRANSLEELVVNRGTDGVHFEHLNIGDIVNCQVAIADSRVMYAHQQTVPMSAIPSKP